jgi:hypothetical protein
MEAAEPTAQAAVELPTDVRALLEAAAERLNLGFGLARMTVDLQDGRVTLLTRQERIKGTDLERF